MAIAMGTVEESIELRKRYHFEVSMHSLTSDLSGVTLGAPLALSLLSLVACQGGRSHTIRSQDCCVAYQRTDRLPDRPPSRVVRIAVGGDSRNDNSHVLPWAFSEARRRGAQAFFFLGDMELDPSADGFFAKELTALWPGLPFYPVIGNHEVERFGAVRLPGDQHAVKEFREDFFAAPAVQMAPIAEVAYAADVGGIVHLIALDNVSRRGEGFGAAQLTWLARDLEAASAAKKVILVGMHKALARNPITTHAMDEDGVDAVMDSDTALALFKRYKVTMVFVSHSHMYAAYNQQGVEMRLTGGLGAPLVKGLADADGGFHHFLLLDVPLDDKDRTPLLVEVVRFPGKPTRAEQDEH